MTRQHLLDGSLNPEWHPKRGPRVNYIGLRAGKLVAVEIAGKSRDGHQMLRCRCDCGNVVLRSSNNFLKNSIESTKSHCGCTPTRPNLTHGKRNTPEYRVWGAIKKRCLNPADKDYARYGGSGIGIAEEFKDNFPAFLAEVGQRPSPKHQIDRIDTRRGYEPGNVRWVTPTQNARNKRTTYLWNIKGERFESSTDAARRFGVAVCTVICWTDGRFDRRRGTFTPPRPDCSRRLRYANGESE